MCRFQWENQSLSHTLNNGTKSSCLLSFSLVFFLFFDSNSHSLTPYLQPKQQRGKNRFHLENHFLIFHCFMYFMFYCRKSFALYSDIVLFVAQPTFPLSGASANTSAVHNCFIQFRHPNCISQTFPHFFFLHKVRKR